MIESQTCVGRYACNVNAHFSINIAIKIGIIVIVGFQCLEGASIASYITHCESTAACVGIAFGFGREGEIQAIIAFDSGKCNDITTRNAAEFQALAARVGLRGLYFHRTSAQFCPAIRKTFRIGFKVFFNRSDSCARSGESISSAPVRLISCRAVSLHAYSIFGIGRSGQRVGILGDTRHFGTVHFNRPFSFTVVSSPSNVSRGSSNIVGSKAIRSNAGGSFANGHIVKINVCVAVAIVTGTLEHDNDIVGSIKTAQHQRQ